MSLRRFLVEDPPRHGEASLDADTSKHVVKVMRLRPGDAVTLFDGRGTEWAGTLTAADRRGVRVAVGEARPAPPPPSPRLLLATAVPKGKRMSTLLSMATEAGVDAVVPVDCVRSSVRGVRPAKVEHWGRTVLGAVRQCGRAWIPAVEPEVPLPEFLRRPPAPGERRFLASTRPGSRPLAALLEGTAPPPAAVVLVGPEGGFTDGEEEAAVAAGFLPCSLGPHILRVETAGMVATSLLRGCYAFEGVSAAGAGAYRGEEE